MKKLSFAVIGAGPAGFYIGKCLTKLQQQPVIHIYEKQYCPFGLLRYGVAPDHVTVKKSENTLSQISNYPNFKYFGNANITENTLKQLKQSYSGVIYAIGAQKNNVPSWMPKRNENFQFISAKALNARDIVYWYNNHPQYQNVHLDFSNKRDVLIIGNGNVAIDIARVLLKPIQLLVHSEISSNALETLKKSNVTNVILAARRGFTHSAFSLKEIRELTTAKIMIYCIEQELDKSFNEASAKECTDIGNHHAAIVRMNKRKIEFVKKNCKIIKRAELDSVLKNNQKKVILRYLLDPLQTVQGEMRFVVNKPTGEAFAQTSERTDEKDVIKFDLLVNSTGFKVEPIKQEGIKRGSNSIQNSHGCVISRQSDKIERGEYVVGWCKTGPKGVIDQTLLGCQQTYNNIRIHIKNNVLEEKPLSNLQFADSKYSFEKYLQLKELELSLGDKQKFIKKKLSHKQVEQFFNR